MAGGLSSSDAVGLLPYGKLVQVYIMLTVNLLLDLRSYILVCTVGACNALSMSVVST